MNQKSPLSYSRLTKEQLESLIKQKKLSAAEMQEAQNEYIKRTQKELLNSVKKKNQQPISVNTIQDKLPSVNNLMQSVTPTDKNNLAVKTSLAGCAILIVMFIVLSCSLIVISSLSNSPINMSF